MSKRTYKKGMQFFHKDTRQKVTFGKWNTDGTAACVSETFQFINVPKDEMDTAYGSYSEIEKTAKEKRRGQAWK